ncbi:XK-related protein 6 [Procambarus clarkii]|uniref:XK-related protein 6 n=1 Tax=Procambarus clarkii TaxID=6728 RepID=UPI003743F6D9
MTEAGERSQLRGEAAVPAMTEAWGRRSQRSSEVAARDPESLQEDQRVPCCCGLFGPPCSTCFRIFMKYTVGRTLQLALYVLDIATDVGVAVADYNNGDTVFASITLGLVFAPGVLFAIYQFTEVLTSHTGFLACLKAPLWLFSFPLLPLWPVVRDLRQIYHGIMAMLPSKREEHLHHLDRPSRAYLIKFLEAFTEAAPQFLLRLYKITLKSQNLPFSQFETIEVAQLSFSLLTLAMKIISTYQKNVTTQQIINGDMEDNQQFKLPCCIQIVATVWWASFLVARFEAMALFAGAYKWWIFVVIGIHVVLVALFQTMAVKKNRIKRIFIYLFSGFIFIFAYLEFNMKARVKVAPWFPYTIYAVLVFMENSIMLVLWFFAQQIATFSLPEADKEVFTTHREYLIFVHYGAFCFGLLMMILTFCCLSKRSQDINGKDNEEEMRTVLRS